MCRKYYFFSAEKMFFFTWRKCFHREENTFTWRKFKQKIENYFFFNNIQIFVAEKSKVKLIVWAERAVHL